MRLRLVNVLGVIRS